VESIVVGDVLPLQPGSRVAADGRLFTSAGLLVDETPLTGESSPQPKDAGARVAADADLADRPTAIFAGTTVLDGRGRPWAPPSGRRRGAAGLGGTGRE
jgi:Ca2+-transporting ATPase